jgi:hypothetical protein
MAVRSVTGSETSRFTGMARLDTRTADGGRRVRPLRGGEAYDLEARCLALFRLHRRE